jgi:hypothetical protein
MVPRVITTRSKHVTTSEDWHPTVDGRVEVSAYVWDDGKARVVVRGGDDTCMELDASPARVSGLFDSIGDGVTRERLVQLGLRMG